MLLTNAQKALKESGYQFLKGCINKGGMTYGFYSTTIRDESGGYCHETIYQVKTCSCEVAAVMVVNNVKVIKY